jgi:hypothetical protein
MIGDRMVALVSDLLEHVVKVVAQLYEFLEETSRDPTRIAV